MWKYLVINSLWFSILFLVHFVGSSKDRRVVFVSIFVLASYLASKTAIDPFVWAYYLIFSLLVFYGAYQFRQWVFGPAAGVELEIEDASRELARSREVYSAKALETEAVERRAFEISGLYDKVREMSQSLDLFEAFVVFGEALAQNFEFGSVKLVLFDENNPGMILSEEVYELEAAALKGVFDRGPLLKNRQKTRGTLLPGDTRIFNHIFKTQKPVMSGDLKQIFEDPGLPETRLSAYPVLINRKVFGILMLSGFGPENPKLLHILIERFIAEAERIGLYERVQTLAITDGLTGIYVRRHLLERFSGEMDRSRRFGFKLSFLMIDIDYFKNFNDSYGHLVGDVVLRQVAETIKSSVREVDLVGRYGGEEFGVLLIETDENLALMVAERIRRSIEEKSFQAYDEKLKVTVSIGCSTYVPPGVMDAHRLIECADSALYRAKREGRNRVCPYHLPE